MQKKVLVVAYTFPPIPYGGTYRSMRLCKGLHARHIETHVLTIKIYSDIPNDFGLLEKVPESVHIHRTPIIDPVRRYMTWKKNHQETKGWRLVNKVLSAILWGVSLPDHMVLWVPFAVMRGLKVILAQGIKTVYVSSPPDSSQLIGYFLKKCAHVKWVADFRDPVVGNIAEVHLMRGDGLRTRVERGLKTRLERLIVKSADEVIVNTETHRRLLMESYGKRTFVTVRNSFDEGDYEGVNTRRYEPFTIAHVGSMYGLRRAETLFQAVKRLEEELGQLRFQVLFIGLNDPQLSSDVRHVGVGHYVRIKPMVPHQEAIEIMTRSHMLLLVKATGEGSLGQIPGKFYEYLGTRNKILCIGPPESEVAGIIRQIGAGYVVNDDVEGLLDIIRGEYEAYLKGETQGVDESSIEGFKSEHMARKIIDRL